MSYFDFPYSWPPEPPLEPPEDTRRYIPCVICDDPIYEYTEAFSIPGFGHCCPTCIEESRRIEVTFD